MKWRNAGEQDRGIAWLWFATVAAALAAAPLAPFVAALVPGCPMHEWTGWPCPTCGSTRALSALAAARMKDAIRFNPLVTLSVLALSAGGLMAPLWVRFRWPLPVVPAPWPARWRIALVVLVAANWAYLIALGV